MRYEILAPVYEIRSVSHFHKKARLNLDISSFYVYSYIQLFYYISALHRDVYDLKY